MAIGVQFALLTLVKDYERFTSATVEELVDKLNKASEELDGL